MKRIVFSLLVLLAAVSCERNNPDAEEWRQLLNGKDLNDWRPKITGYPLDENFGNTFHIDSGKLVEIGRAHV